MGFLKKIFSFFESPSDSKNYWFFVQCDFCKEVLKGRIDMQNDLSPVYSEENDELTYFCRKVLIGSKRCYRPIEVEFRFTANRKLLNRQIQGGQFVDEAAYLEDQHNPS